MIVSRYLRRLCGLLAGMAGLLTAGANAQDNTLPAAEGDIFLCFRATAGLGSNTDYMVNIGPFTQFTMNGTATIDLGGAIVTDLENIYGPDWSTRAEVVWSVSGVQKFAGNGLTVNNTMFASRAQTIPGTQSDGWTTTSSAGQSQPALRMVSMREAYAVGTRDDNSQSKSTVSTKALIQSVSAPNSYRSYMPGGANTVGLSAFGFYAAAGGIEASFANGAASSVVDFYKLEPNTGAAALLGGFRLNGSAELTFSSDITFFQGPALVSLDAANYAVSEDVAGGKVTLTVTRAGNANSAFTLNLSTSDDSAIAGTDYVAHSNTPIVFASGETSKTVDVTIISRPGFQGDRSFNATLTVSAGTPQLVAPSAAVINITESTPQPAILALSAATYTVAENVAGGIVTVTVNRSGALNNAVTVNLSTADGTAVAGTDFTAQTNTQVSFAATETTKTVDIAVASRAGFQGDRTFNVTLSSPSAQAELGTPATAAVIIQENEPNPAGTLAFSAATFQFSATTGGQPTTLIIPITRSNGTTGAVTVDVSVTGGTLTAGSDFTFASPLTVNFADGQATADLSIPMLAGASPLPGTINVQLGNATGGASIGGQGSTVITVNAPVVINPDPIAPKLTLTSPRPGKSGATFNVSGTVQDPDAIDRVEVRLNGGLVQLATLQAPSGTSTAFVLNGLNAENGPNTLLVQAFDVKGTATKVAKVAFTYVNTRPELAGLYTGLITPTAATPPGDNLHNASGLLTLSVTPTGAFTGKVLIGGASLPIGGILANDQTARFKTAFGATLTLAIKGKTPVVLGDLALAVVGGKVEGTIGNTSTIEAERAAFDGRTATPDPDYLQNKGKYTAVFPSKAQAVLASAQFPQGDGVGAITITKQGKLSFKGKLADGTPVSMSAPLSAGLKAALYAPLYAKKGSIAGTATLDKNAANSDLEGQDFLWLRPAISNAKHYPAGWTDGVEVDLVGARYSVPAAASVLPDLGAEDPVAGNATLAAEDGKLTAAVAKNVSISPKNKVTNAPATDKTFKLTIAAPTGAISGLFPHTDGTKTKFAGVILQKGANQGGFGYFLSNVPRGGASGESGGVSLTAK